MISRTFTARLFPLACLSSALPITRPHVPFRSSTPSTLSFFFVAATAPHACIPVQMCMHDWFNETTNARAVQGRRRPCMQVRRGAPAAAGGPASNPIGIKRPFTMSLVTLASSCEWALSQSGSEGSEGRECSGAVSPLSWRRRQPGPGHPHRRSAALSSGVSSALLAYCDTGWLLRSGPASPRSSLSSLSSPLSPASAPRRAGSARAPSHLPARTERHRRRRRRRCRYRPLSATMVPSQAEATMDSHVSWAEEPEPAAAGDQPAAPQPAAPQKRPPRRGPQQQRGGGQRLAGPPRRPDDAETKAMLAKLQETSEAGPGWASAAWYSCCSACACTEEHLYGPRARPLLTAGCCPPPRLAPPAACSHGEQAARRGADSCH